MIRTVVAPAETTADHTRPFAIRPHGRGWPPRGRLIIRSVGAVTMALWLAGLITFSTVLYQRNFLGGDFAAYSQAWTLIGEGHLNPFSTIYFAHPFVKNDLELIIWPLALLHVLDHQPVVLLWVQDLGVAASGYVVYVWIADYLERRKVTWAVAVGVSAVVLLALVANPGVYQTLLFDFHLEPISTVFVLLAGRDLWWGRFRRAWLWIALTLLCGSFSAITLVGLGLSALLAGRATRRQGLSVMAVALAWLALISLLGANAGSGLDYYAYLAGRRSLAGSSGLALVFGGILAHPSKALQVVHARLNLIWLLIKPVGVVGLASAWGFGIPVVVMLTNVLNSQEGFIFQAFQNFAVFPFLLLGTVMVLVWLAQRYRVGWVAATVVGVVVSVLALDYGVTTSPGNIRWAVAQVDSAQATELDRALSLTPADAEVIATGRTMGRFAGRPSAYWEHNGPIPVTSRPVVFVFDPANENTIGLDPADDLAAIAFVAGHLDARMLVDAHGVAAYEWHPPPGTKSVWLPRAPTIGHTPAST